MTEEELSKAENNIVAQFILEVKKAGRTNDARMQKILMTELREAGEHFRPVCKGYCVDDYGGY